jgi:pimeloyl-ACP methyl ester carboxylesterase
MAVCEFGTGGSVPVETLREVELAYRYADLGEVRLHYVEVGEGPLVLLLHGFPQFWYEWRHQVPALVEAGFRVVAPDMRGYYLSDKQPGVRAYRVELLARDVERLILACGARTADVVGHDWGAIVGRITAMRNPGRVGTLAILNGPHPARFLEELLSPMQLLRSSYTFFFHIPWLPEGVIREGDFALLRKPGELRALLQRVEAPLLVIWGERNRFLSQRLAEPSHL